MSGSRQTLPKMGAPVKKPSRGQLDTLTAIQILKKDVRKALYRKAVPLGWFPKSWGEKEIEIIMIAAIEPHELKNHASQFIEMFNMPEGAFIRTLSLVLATVDKASKRGPTAIALHQAFVEKYLRGLSWQEINDKLWTEDPAALYRDLQEVCGTSLTKSTIEKARRLIRDIVT